MLYAEWTAVVLTLQARLNVQMGFDVLDQQWFGRVIYVDFLAGAQRRRPLPLTALLGFGLSHISKHRVVFEIWHGADLYRYDNVGWNIGYVGDVWHV